MPNSCRCKFCSVNTALRLSRSDISFLVPVPPINDVIDQQLLDLSSERRTIENLHVGSWVTADRGDRHPRLQIASHTIHLEWLGFRC
jgi:hypothetical protein